MKLKAKLNKFPGFMIHPGSDDIIEADASIV